MDLSLHNAHRLAYPLCAPSGGMARRFFFLSPGCQAGGRERPPAPRGMREARTAAHRAGLIRIAAAWGFGRRRSWRVRVPEGRGWRSAADETFSNPSAHRGTGEVGGGGWARAVRCLVTHGCCKRGRGGAGGGRESGPLGARVQNGSSEFYTTSIIGSRPICTGQSVLAPSVDKVSVAPEPSGVARSTETELQTDRRRGRSHDPHDQRCARAVALHSAERPADEHSWRHADGRGTVARSERP